MPGLAHEIGFNAQLNDPNNFGTNTQDFRYTTEYQVTTVDMLVFIV